MSGGRPNRNQEQVDDLTEEALELAMDTEEILTKFRDMSNALLASVQDRKHRLSVKGQRAGFAHARPEYLRSRAI